MASLRGFLAIALLLSASLALFSIHIPEASASVQPSILQLKTWGGTQSDYATGIALDSLGNIYVAGLTYSFGPGSPTCPALFIVKYNPLGAIVWQKIWYNGSLFQGAPKIAVDSSGSVYVAGSIYTSCGGGSSNPFVIKLDSSGNIAWQKFYNSNTNYGFTGVAVDSSGHVYATGDVFYHSQDQLLLVRLASSDGTLQLQKTWGGIVGTTLGWGVATDGSGDVFVSGQSNSFGPGTHAVLVGFDSSGNWKFNKIIGSAEHGYGVALDGSGNIYLSGSTYSYAGGHTFLAKFDSSTGPVWQRSWGGSNGTDYPVVGGIAVDPAGNPIIVGYSTSYGAGGPACGGPTCPSAYLVKVNPAGTTVLSSIVLGTYNKYTIGYGVGCDSFGNCVAAGQVQSAPPYFTTGGNGTLGSPALTISSTGNSTLDTPPYQVESIPNSASQSVTGSQTYAGSFDAFFLKYGLPPQVTFATTPTSSGSINFNGTSYTNGQNGNYTIGNATATAIAPTGYHFSSWTTTGGLSVSSQTTNPTIVSVAGAGTLRANYISNAPVSPVAVLISSLIAIPFLLIRRRKPS